MKEALLSGLVLAGLYAILSLCLPERESVKKSLSFFFSVTVVLLVFTPLLSGELFRPFEDWRSEAERLPAIGDGDDYFQDTTEKAVTRAFLSHLTEHFAIAASEATLTVDYTEGLTPTHAVLRLTGRAALCDLVAIEAYGREHFTESFEVMIDVG